MSPCTSIEAFKADVMNPRVQMGDNPIYGGGRGPNPHGSQMGSQMPEGDEDDYEGMPPPNYSQHMGKGMPPASRDGRSSG